MDFSSNFSIGTTLMDSFTGSFSGSTIASDCYHESVSAYSDLYFVDGFGFEDNSVLNDGVDLRATSNMQYPIISNRLESVDADSAEEKDVSDAVLRYIDQVLMEDHSDNEAFTIQDSTLDAAEKSLYEILHKDPSCSSSSPDSTSETQTSWQFSDTIEETINALPCGNLETSDYGCNGLTPSVAKEKVLTINPNPEKEEGKLLDRTPRRRKSLHREESDLEEGRNKKHYTLCAEEAILHEMFERVVSLYRDALPNGVSVEFLQKRGVKRSDDELAYSRKGISKREAIDMRNLLMQCMQSVASNDHGRARTLLKQIRSRSSPLGDGSQRLAHYFANGLEARLTGLGNMEYKSLASKMSDAGALRAYKLYLSAFPFMETTYYFANQVILELANKATTLHIISGITFGFQWPYLIQHLSARPGGPPKLRITGIEFPKEGLRLASRFKETVANCCEKYNVPFEYNGIAQKWETICVEDLKIQKDEVIVVNCLYLSMYILDDLTANVSPRDAFLKLIKMISPDIFVHATVNGNYNSPFFVSRFREALFHFSSLFDMVEAILTREDQDRIVFERDILGNAFLNVIACEGVGRIVRPETYKQWQTRTVRAGFRQLPLKQEIIKEVKAKVKLCYHKGFFIKEDSGWMLTGWKGRAIFAFSCWKPA
ncbi:hypothetical protein RHSIM_Rhsim01G0230300 [Rhododendron simsii]|uniref:Uncharacterized protein n=1 Tax=Rhododendron simsii TaxID=118357 RepID=A0A834M2F5_RHOSS|nr:hypothetical protein RHSIM_Rhsim01G0230300 [Rhododendron simsii]